MSVESKQKISVDEGYDEISVEYLPEPNIPERNYDNYSVTATTYINNESILKLKVKPEFIVVTDIAQYLRFSVEITGDIVEDSHPKKLKIVPIRNKTTGARSDTTYSFSNVHLVTNNSTYKDSIPGRDLFIDIFKIDSNEFRAYTQMSWDIPIENCGNPYTLHIHGVLEGMSEDVTVTIDLHIEGGFEG